MIAENDSFRVIQASWKPGQRDDWHSHSGAETTYRLTACDSRIYTPDGKFRDRHGNAGEVTFNPAIAAVLAHSFENVGTSECRALIVQTK